MFQTLRLKMTIFCTIATGIILVGMTLTGLRFFLSLLDENDAMAYEKNLNSILTYMDGQNLIDYSTLAKIADTRFYTITVYENGMSYFLPRDTQQTEITALACDTAKSEYNFDVSDPPKTKAAAAQVRFQMEYENEDYFVAFASVPNKYTSLCTAIIYRREQLTHQIQQLQILFLLIDVLTFLLLFLFAWIFSGRMLRPLEYNQQKQIQFIASASHELRSPLAVMLSSAEALKIADEADLPGFHKAISSEGLRMTRLIDDMLSLANADSQTWPMHFAPTELDTMLLDLYEKYLPLCRNHQLSLSIDLPETAFPPVVCDRQRMEQVMGILLDNAMSYTPTGGKVTLGIRLEGSGIRLWISDTGPGISDEQKEQIFDRFFRADAARKEKNHFGLGLCIAKEIMRLHHGKIWVEDNPEGGSVFCLLLPVKH